jgi:hypothetical protein
LPLCVLLSLDHLSIPSTNIKSIFFPDPSCVIGIHL